MKFYKELPENGDFVIVTVESVNPHSVFVSLDEYPGKEGLIHISEISRTWVRDIRKHVRKHEKRVAYVLNVDTKTENINLSLKRVNEKQKRDKMNEWKKEKKADRFLEKVSKLTKKPMDVLYKEIAFPFQREFGNTFDGFEKVLIEEESVKKILKKEYFDAVKKIAGENISLKEVEIENYIILEIPKPDGVNIIKEVLDVGEDAEITYISAPRYKLKVWGRNKESCIVKMKSLVERIRKDVEHNEGVFSVERSKV